MYSNLPLKEFVNELASSSSTPGGGSASSIVASFGFSLVSMVMGIYQKKNPNDEIATLINDAKETAFLLLELSSKDAEAFNKFMEVLKLPKDTDEEKEKRKKLMQDALIGAALVPLEVIETIYKKQYLLEKAKDFCPKSAISDLWSALCFIDSAFEGAKANVIINLQAIKDDKFVTDTNAKLLSIESEFKNKINTLKEEIRNSLKI
jgi:formiminotetrahydrofolate cyclodeaminase